MQETVNIISHKLLVRITMWLNNYGDNEGLTKELFHETFGSVMGDHYLTKWDCTYRHDLLKMIGYFGPNSTDGQLFCNMITLQLNRYESRTQNKN